jgi:hypothetical protein
MAAPTITQGFVIDFGKDVHLEFNQRSAMLRPTVDTRGIIRAETARFYVMGNGITQTKSRNGDIPQQDLDLSYVTATMADRYWRKDVDKLDMAKVTAELRPILVEDASGAFGRYADDQIIQAMDAGAGTNLGNSTTETRFGRNAALGMFRTLMNTGMRNDGRIFAAITPNACSQLMTEPEFASADYTGPTDLPWKAMGMDIRTWLGVHWIVCTRNTGNNTSQAFQYMWHQSAVGHAVNAEVEIEFAQKEAGWGWIAKGAMSMGAVVKDGTGVVRYVSDDTLALAADVNTSIAGSA